VLRHGGRVFRAGFAPVRTDSGIVAVVAIEAPARYVRAVEDLGRTLLFVTLGTLVAILLLAGVVIRGARAAAALERRLSRADNLAAMGRLTAVLAHEIKNPLAIIRGSAQRLGKLEPEAQRMSDYVVEEVDRLSGTVGRYLQFARGAAGGALAAAGSGDAIEALEATLALLEGELRARSVSLERRGAAGPAPVALDNGSLQQVYLNLVLNALDASPAGGTITVDVVEHAQRWEVAIADHGPGFPAEVLRQLGEPFLTTRAEGSGLGLFLARRLLQSAGGDI
jgi:signal transduction histidine kinase